MIFNYTNNQVMKSSFAMRFRVLMISYLEHL